MPPDSRQHLLQGRNQPVEFGFALRLEADLYSEPQGDLTEDEASRVASLGDILAEQLQGLEEYGPGSSIWSEHVQIGVNGIGMLDAARRECTLLVT